MVGDGQCALCGCMDVLCATTVSRARSSWSCLFFFCAIGRSSHIGACVSTCARVFACVFTCVRLCIYECAFAYVFVCFVCFACLVFCFTRLGVRDCVLVCVCCVLYSAASNAGASTLGAGKAQSVLPPPTPAECGLVVRLSGPVDSWFCFVILNLPRLPPSLSCAFRFSFSPIPPELDNLCGVNFNSAQGEWSYHVVCIRQGIHEAVA